MLKSKIIFFYLFVCSLYPIAAQSNGKRILIYPMTGNGVSAGEATDIANDIKTTLINDGYTFAVEPRVVLKLAADKQKIGEEVNDLGKIYKTDYIMPCTLTKLNQTYKINCEIYHKITDEKGLESWESWAGTGTVNYGNSLEDLSKKITNKGDKTSINERLRVEEKTSTSSCQNVNSAFFMRRLTSCAQEKNPASCFEPIIDNQCTAINNKSNQCIESCNSNAALLLAYILIQLKIDRLEKDITSCSSKGQYFNYDIDKEQCINTNEAAEKEAYAKKQCEAKGSDYYWSSSKCKLTDAATIRLKKECETDGGTWNVDTCKYPHVEYYPSLSWIIPGAGLISKRRTYWGIFFFATTVGAASDYYNKLQVYNDKKEEYRSFIPVPFPLNFGLLGNYLYYDMRYSALNHAAKDVSNASDLLIIFYITQLMISYNQDADVHFFSSLERDNKKLLTYNFNIKRDSPYGVPNSFGTLYTFSLNWRF